MFANRTDAGQRLAQALLRFKDERPVILALPRGGVPVAFEVAQALAAPLDLLLIRKIGVPGQPELALGAVVDGDHPHLVINRDIAALVEASDAYVAEQEAEKLREIEERRTLYLKGRHRPEIAGRTVIVVDDGVATGATMRAALEALREMRLKHLVVAVPVAPADTQERVRQAVDELICLETPEIFHAIGHFYLDFRQMTDEEVIYLLDRAAGLSSGTNSSTSEIG